MKKFLATTSIALVAMASTASAQSVLERVLSTIDNGANLASVNGTFANIAENLGGSGAVSYVDADGGTVTEATYDSLVATAAATNITAISNASAGIYSFDGDGTANDVVAVPLEQATAAATQAANDKLALDYTLTVAAGGIDGSITNIINGVTADIADATQSSTTGAATAYEFNLPTYDLGALSTTALGAVNTGDITLGVNSTVDEAKTTSTQAVSSVMEQLGGAAGNGALVLNIASNMTGVNGSINNTMNNVNGVLASASTTALGAVNTGTIVSGVNSAVQGIVGTSGSATN